MKVTASASVLTVGHSSHSAEHFLALLRGAGVTAIADVRTVPASRRFPHFTRKALVERLAGAGIVYLFLGDALGGRPRDPRLLSGNAADYENMARAAPFRDGLATVVEAAGQHRLALMCAERDPLDCHRCLLVGRALAESGVGVGHILADGSIIRHREIEDKLLILAGLEADDLLLSRPERLAAAYRARARKIAFPRQGASVSGGGRRGLRS